MLQLWFLSAIWEASRFYLFPGLGQCYEWASLSHLQITSVSQSSCHLRKDMVNKWSQRRPTKKNPEACGPEQMFVFGWDCRKPFLQAKLLRCSEFVGLPNQKDLSWNVFFNSRHLAISQTLIWNLFLELEIFLSLVIFKFFSRERRVIYRSFYH